MFVFLLWLSLEGKCRLVAKDFSFYCLFPVTEASLTEVETADDEGINSNFLNIVCIDRQHLVSLSYV